MKKYSDNAFRVALSYFLDTKKSANQADLAKLINKTQQNISAMKRGKSGGLEADRRLIASYFGYEYDNFLEIGERIIRKTNQVVEKSESLPFIKPDKINVIGLHEKLIKNFDDPEWGYRMNKCLVEIEKDPLLKNYIEQSISMLYERLKLKKIKKKRKKV